jgi:hypothetical protein
LLACLESVDWNAIDYTTRLVVLHQINEHITRLREGAGLAAISDPIPPAPLNVFFTIKNKLFPNSLAKAGS